MVSDKQIFFPVVVVGRFTLCGGEGVIISGVATSELQRFIIDSCWFIDNDNGIGDVSIDGLIEFVESLRFKLIDEFNIFW